jgi:hypothetical protein
MATFLIVALSAVKVVMVEPMTVDVVNVLSPVRVDLPVTLIPFEPVTVPSVTSTFLTVAPVSLFTPVKSRPSPPVTSAGELEMTTFLTVAVSMVAAFRVLSVPPCSSSVPTPVPFTLMALAPVRLSVSTV